MKTTWIPRCAHIIICVKDNFTHPILTHLTHCDTNRHILIQMGTFWYAIYKGFEVCFKKETQTNLNEDAKQRVVVLSIKI